MEQWRERNSVFRHPSLCHPGCSLTPLLLLFTELWLNQVHHGNWGIWWQVTFCQVFRADITVQQTHTQSRFETHVLFNAHTHTSQSLSCWVSFLKLQTDRDFKTLLWHKITAGRENNSSLPVDLLRLGLLTQPHPKREVMNDFLRGRLVHLSHKKRKLS